MHLSDKYKMKCGESQWYFLCCVGAPQAYNRGPPVDSHGRPPQAS